MLSISIISAKFYEYFPHMEASPVYAQGVVYPLQSIDSGERVFSTQWTKKENKLITFYASIISVRKKMFLTFTNKNK